MRLKSLFFVTAILFTFSFAAFSQKAVTNYSGQWKADLSKSEFPEMIKGIEGISMIVKQDEKTIAVEVQMNGGRGGFGGGIGSGRGNGSGGGMERGQMPRREPQATVYSLDGKETSSEVGGGGPFARTATLKAILSSEDLKLSSIRKGNSPMGEFTMTTNETWKLSADGKTLIVNQERETPRGNMSAKIVFTKSAGIVAMRVADVEAAKSNSETSSTTSQVPKRVTAGVLNGMAIKLPKVEYPAEARARNIGGAVHVKIVIDREGNVIDAKATEGPDELRAVSETAARGAKFHPIKLGGNPVEVTGVIIYNFVAAP